MPYEYADGEYVEIGEDDTVLSPRALEALEGPQAQAGEAMAASLRGDGLAVLLISSEIEEIVRNCARVLVLRERSLAGEVAAADLTPARLMRIMAGGSSHE